MNLSKLFIAILTLPYAAWGSDFCSVGQPLAQDWRNQIRWTELTVTPSVANPAIQVKTFKDEKGRMYIQPVDINTGFQARMEMNVSSPYTQEKFVQICKTNEHGGQRLYGARNEGSTNQFRMQLNYLPSVQSSAANPYLSQQLKTEAGDVGVRIVLNKGSIIYENSNMFNSAKAQIADMTQKINLSLQNQIKSNFNGSADLILDGMDDLACDLMTGKAELEFFHFSKMNSAKIDVTNPIQADDVVSLYEELQQNLVGQTKEENLLEAGATWMKQELQGEIQIKDHKKAFKIMLQLFEKDMTKIKSLENEELVCLAENETDYKKTRRDQSVVLNVKPQSIFAVETK